MTSPIPPARQSADEELVGITRGQRGRTLEVFARIERIVKERDALAAENARLTQERDETRRSLEDTSTLLEEETDAREEACKELRAAEARIVSLEAALKHLHGYAEQMETFVYDREDRCEHQFMIEARAALNPAQETGQ